MDFFEVFSDASTIMLYGAVLGWFAGVTCPRRFAWLFSRRAQRGAACRARPRLAVGLSPCPRHSAGREPAPSAHPPTLALPRCRQRWYVWATLAGTPPVYSAIRHAWAACLFRACRLAGLLVALHCAAGDAASPAGFVRPCVVQPLAPPPALPPFAALCRHAALPACSNVAALKRDLTDLGAWGLPFILLWSAGMAAILGTIGWHVAAVARRRAAPDAAAYVAARALLLAWFGGSAVVLKRQGIDMHIHHLYQGATPGMRRC